MNRTSTTAIGMEEVLVSPVGQFISIRCIVFRLVYLEVPIFKPFLLSIHAFLSTQK